MSWTVTGSGIFGHHRSRSARDDNHARIRHVSLCSLQVTETSMCERMCICAVLSPDEPQKFINVHKVFGASNVSKMLQDLPVQSRGDAVSSMVYEADARVRDPVYGCVGAISSLQHQVSQLQTQLAVANAEIVCIRMHQAGLVSNQHQQTHLNDGNMMTANSPPLPPPSPQLEDSNRWS